MIKAYIYGTPKGFDAYGSDKSFEGYLKGFYITSRRGKRLMVNRRANGETIYSYLHYGLMEYSDIGKDKAGRINSFFGMSLHISDGIYTPDLKRVFDWFDYWFNKILEDGTILKKVSSEYIQYQVSKFANANNIEHLHSNLPNIFSDKSGTLMLDYDDTFIEGKPGQIAQLNSDENENIVLSTFKNYQWVALSPNFKKIDKPTDISIELDYNDLNVKLGEYRKLLLPIAIKLNDSSVDELCKINDAVQGNYSSITLYLKTLSNDKDNVEEYNKFSSLASEYVAVCENITALKLKLLTGPDGGGTNDKPKTQFCYNCQEYKDISEFRSPEATTCIACEEKIAQSHKKQCKKCGEIKPCTDFEEGSKICKACKREKANTGFIIPSWAKITVPSAIILGVAVICILKFINKPNPVPTPTQTVDDKTFELLINEYKYQEAYDYLTDKSNKDEYLPFDKKIFAQVWASINGNTDSSDTTSLRNIRTKINRLSNDAIAKATKDMISEIDSLHKELIKILSLDDKQFDPKSRDTATNIIFNIIKHGDYGDEQKDYNEKWTDSVNSKFAEYERLKKQNNKPNPSKPDQQDYGSICLVQLNINLSPIQDKKEEITLNPSKEGGYIHHNKQYKKGTFVDICYDKSKVTIQKTGDEKVIESNRNPEQNPQANSCAKNATFRLRFLKMGAATVSIKDMNGNVLSEITFRTKQ